MAFPAAIQSEPSSQLPAILSRSTRRLRILHVITRLGQGGTEHGILKLVNGLSGSPLEHAICTIRGFEPETAAIAAPGIKIFSAGNDQSRFSLLALKQVMKDYKPDIVHSRNWGTIEAVPAARWAGVPVVIHSEHGYELDMLESMPIRRRLMRRVAFAMADCVFTVSAELRDFHAKQAWLSVSRVQVLANGVDSWKFSPRLHEKAQLRRELQLSEQSCLIGSVGRLVAIKDYPTLLRAAHSLILRGADLNVVLAGAGPELETLQKLAASMPELSGRVFFAGSSSRVPELLNALDIFVLPSISEGMSNSILEAMSSGLPVVASRTGGNPELVVDGVSGVLFRPGDVKGLASILQRLIENPELRDSLAVAARNRVLERFDLHQMLDNYRNLYTGLAEKRRLLGGEEH
jgi:sugar transferase (PEP-CTERM/EpsH1 system associated)